MADHTQCHRDIARLLDELGMLQAAITEHRDTMTALGSAGGDQDRKLWRILEYRPELIDGQDAGGKVQ